MALNPEMRASDADRDKVAAALREHMAQGRLTADELQERLEQTFQARTFGDLQKITSDLPEQDLYDLPVPSWRRSTPGMPANRRDGGLYHRSLAVAWSSWAAGSLICAVIWLLTVLGSQHWIYPWPIWVAGPWGAVILASTIFGPKPKD